MRAVSSVFYLSEDCQPGGSLSIARKSSEDVGKGSRNFDKGGACSQTYSSC